MPARSRLSSSSSHRSRSSPSRQQPSRRLPPRRQQRRLRRRCRSVRCRKQRRRSLQPRRLLLPLPAASCHGSSQSCLATCHLAWVWQQPRRLGHQALACHRRPHCPHRVALRPRLPRSRHRHLTPRHQAWGLQASTQQQHSRRLCRGHLRRRCPGPLARPPGKEPSPRAVRQCARPSAWMGQQPTAAWPAGRRRSRSSGQPRWMWHTEQTCSTSARRWVGRGR